MATKLRGLTRHLVGNRRGHRRRRHLCDTILRDDTQDVVLFRGKTRDLSRGGASVCGLPCGLGPSPGQRVRAEFLLIPEDLGQVEYRAVIFGRIIRIEEREDTFIVAVRFDPSLAG